MAGYAVAYRNRTGIDPYDKIIPKVPVTANNYGRTSLPDTTQAGYGGINVPLAPGADPYNGMKPNEANLPGMPEWRVPMAASASHPLAGMEIWNGMDKSVYDNSGNLVSTGYMGGGGIDPYAELTPAMAANHAAKLDANRNTTELEKQRLYNTGRMNEQALQNTGAANVARITNPADRYGPDGKGASGGADERTVFNTAYSAAKRNFATDEAAVIAAQNAVAGYRAKNGGIDPYASKITNPNMLTPEQIAALGGSTTPSKRPPLSSFGR